MTQAGSDAPTPDGTTEPSSRLRRLSRLGLTVVVLGFVGYAGYGLAGQWDSSAVDIDWTYALLSLAPLVVGSFVLATAWKVLLDRMTGQSVPTRRAIALHIESQLARYLPGKVGIPLVRVAGASGLGVSGRVAGASLAVEMLSFLTVGGGVGFLLLTLTSSFARSTAAFLGSWTLVMLVAFGLGATALLVIDRRRLPAVVLRALKAEGSGPLMPARVPLVHVVYWLTWAAHGYLVSAAVGAPANAALAASGLYVLAPLVGLLALVAPAGIGVREAVLALGLATSVGSAAALVAVVLSRAATLVVDFGVWLATRRWSASRPA